MKKHYEIAGMHCRSCELLIEQHISKVPGVHRVKVDHKNGVAEVHHHHELPPDQEHIAQAVRNAGYRIGSAQRVPLISHESADWHEAIVAGCLVFIMYLAYNIFGLERIGSGLTAAAGPASAILVGLVAGISTCMALVGGLVLGMSVRHAQHNPSATRWEKFRPHLAFNAGRLASFAVFGGAIGALGSALRISGGTLGFIIIVAGITMIVMGIKLIGLFPRIQNLALPSGIARAIGLGQTQQGYSHTRSALLGAMTFFVPCGFTQAMQIYAISTGSFAQGAIIMTAFALGTLPGLIGIGGLSSLAQGAAGRMFFKVAGIIVLLLGLWNVSNGWNLTGIVLAQKAPANAAKTNTGRTATAQVRDGKQYVEMTQSVYGYSLDRIVVKRGIPVVWRVNSTNSYTCASSLNIPALNISTTLRPGQNSIEFTPLNKGQMRFACSMGMYRGIIEVID
jgi:sulfite exporter TauE/SafE/copper chaperone CopZ